MLPSELDWNKCLAEGPLFHGSFHVVYSDLQKKVIRAADIKGVVNVETYPSICFFAKLWLVGELNPLLHPPIKYFKI